MNMNFVSWVTISVMNICLKFQLHSFITFSVIMKCPWRFQIMVKVRVRVRVRVRVIGRPPQGAIWIMGSIFDQFQWNFAIVCIFGRRICLNNRRFDLSLFSRDIARAFFLVFSQSTVCTLRDFSASEQSFYMQPKLAVR